MLNFCDFIQVFVFTRNHHLNSVHSYGAGLKRYGCFSLPKVKGFGKRSFAYNGCQFWNKLPSSV